MLVELTARPDRELPEILAIPQNVSLADILVILALGNVIVCFQY